MNVWEAMLNAWRNDGKFDEVRELLLQCLVGVRSALDQGLGSDNRMLTWQIARPALGYELTPSIGHRTRRSGHMI